ERGARAPAPVHHDLEYGSRFVASCVLGVLAFSCKPPPASTAKSDPAPEAPARSASSAASSPEPIDPIPVDAEVAGPIAELLELLFFTIILSSDGHVSCSSCHELDHGLADRFPVSEIPFRPKTATNSTSLFNVRYFYKIKWNGEFDSIDAHLDALVK